MAIVTVIDIQESFSPMDKGEVNEGIEEQSLEDPPTPVSLLACTLTLR